MMVGRPTFGVERRPRPQGPPNADPPNQRPRPTGPRTPGPPGRLARRRRGEIVGVAGVSGNGKTELVELLSGMREPSRGSIAVDGI